MLRKREQECERKIVKEREREGERERKRERERERERERDRNSFEVFELLARGEVVFIKENSSLLSLFLSFSF